MLSFHLLCSPGHRPTTLLTRHITGCKLTRRTTASLISWFSRLPTPFTSCESTLFDHLASLLYSVSIPSPSLPYFCLDCPAHVCARPTLMPVLEDTSTPTRPTKKDSSPDSTTALGCPTTKVAMSSRSQVMIGRSLNASVSGGGPTWTPLPWVTPLYGQTRC
jgi:hypothetical protein